MIVQNTTFKVGDKLTDKYGQEHVLARMEINRVMHVCLIGYANGNRWKEPIPVKSTRNITLEEMDNIIDWGSFPAYQRKEITYKPGDKFLDGDRNKLILLNVDFKKVCLVDLTECNRCLDPIDVNIVNKITEEELNKMTYRKIRKVG